MDNAFELYGQNILLPHGIFSSTYFSLWNYIAPFNGTFSEMPFRAVNWHGFIQPTLHCYGLASEIIHCIFSLAPTFFFSQLSYFSFGKAVQYRILCIYHKDFALFFFSSMHVSDISQRPACWYFGSC